MGWNFERKRLYNRRADIHARFGGQQQGGIITPAHHAVVIVITGDEGLEHGYADRTRPDGTFEYFGAGQVGDMQMLRGNAAIANHSLNGRCLLLFRKDRAGLVFEGEFIYAGHHVKRAADRNGDLRQAIVFELTPIENVEEAINVDDEEISHPGADLQELRERAWASARPQARRNSIETNVFVRSRSLRDYVVARARTKCEGCANPAPFLRANGIPYLEPHHIRRLSDGGPDDPRYVIALCPNCHRRVHSGADGANYNEHLMRLMPDIESTDLIQTKHDG